MKTTFRFFQCVTIVLLFVLGMTSCDSAGPQYAEDEGIKSFVLWNCIDQDYVESLCDKWIAEVDNGKIEIENYEIPEYSDSDVLTLSQECFCLFRYLICNESFMHQNVQSYNFDFDDSYDKFMANFAEWGRVGISDYTNDQIIRNPEQAQLIGSALYSSFHKYFKEYADKHIKMLSWDVDIMNTGDLFSGYTITYEVDSDFYALVTLIEYDSGKCEYRIENKSNSLIELNQ